MKFPVSFALIHVCPLWHTYSMPPALHSRDRGVITSPHVEHLAYVAGRYCTGEGRRIGFFFIPEACILMCQE